MFNMMYLLKLKIYLARYTRLLLRNIYVLFCKYFLSVEIGKNWKNFTILTFGKVALNTNIFLLIKSMHRRKV